VSTEPHFRNKLKAIRRQFWWIFWAGRDRGTDQQSSQAGGEKGGNPLVTLLG
jgi:hypothetical protein